MSLRHLMTSTPFSTIVHRSANCSYDSDSHNKCQDRVFFLRKKKGPDVYNRSRAGVQRQSAELVLLFSFFSTLAISIHPTGLFFPLFEAIPTTSISSNKQDKKWPSRQNNNNNKKKEQRERERERERKNREKENGKQNLNREYKRGTYTRGGEKNSPSYW